MLPEAPMSVWLSAVAFICAVGCGIYAVAARRTSVGRDFLSMPQGLSATQASLRRSGFERLSVSLPDQLREFARRVLPTRTIESTEQRIARAGLSAKWTADRYIAAKVVTSIAVFLLTFLLAVTRGSATMLVLAVGLAALSFVLPDLWLVRKADARDDHILRDLADVVDQILISVEAGASLDAAFRRVSMRGDGPLHREFDRALQDVGFGMSRSQALMAMADRSSVNDLRELLLALSQSEEHGLSVGRILRVQAGEIRERRRMRAEEAALKVPVKIVFPLILCILPCLLAVILGPAAVRIFQEILN